MQFTIEIDRIHIVRYFYILALVLSSCDGRQDEISGPLEESKNIPACIKNKIAELESAPARNPPASIWQYWYKFQTVYYIPPFCCDIKSELFDSDCNLICNPDGGFGGGGDDKCPDFLEYRTHERLIWEDSR
jgi:Domain of unknown function (DUF6970)